ncbi:hypothetical protein [Butyrivibrio sp. INlla14]|uniref:hypothetical protein n=1 Tax=Butyrivibrio sp. INlla14 TaxID=1520808 RepID=UPI000AFCED7B|nr:hypothetical protein [Butyrivibrio sp. INlla14]
MSYGRNVIVYIRIKKVLLEYKDDDAGFEESKEKVLHFAPDAEVYKRASDGQWTLMD